MADGIYLTLQGYIDQFGEEEFTRLTADDAGEQDPAAFKRAANQASADMDTYLATKYALPFAEPYPRQLESIAAALIREKLHGNFPTEAVTKAADEARKRLKDLATGVATLNVPGSGDLPEESTTSGEGVRYSAPPRVFTAEKLARF